jgi:hypothetical protein
MNDDTICEHLLATISSESVFMYGDVEINAALNVLQWEIDATEQMLLEINADEDPQLWLV